MAHRGRWFLADVGAEISTPIGDVTHRNNLTPVAIRKVTLSPIPYSQAFCAGRLPGHSDRGILAAGSRHGRVDRSAGPRAVQHVDIYKTDFRPIKSTISGRDARILMKLVVDGSTDRLVGCHIVGDAAAEIVQAVAIAVR